MSHYVNDHYIDQLRDLEDMKTVLLKEMLRAEEIRDEDWQIQIYHDLLDLEARIERTKDYIYNY